MSSFWQDKMAKSKQSRRARKQQIEKQRQQEAVATTTTPPPQVEEQPQVVDTPAPVAAPKSGPIRKVVNFADEYYYVYTDLRNITIVSLVMFALMFALGYFI